MVIRPESSSQVAASFGGGVDTSVNVSEDFLGSIMVVGYNIIGKNFIDNAQQLNNNQSKSHSKIKDVYDQSCQCWFGNRPSA